MRDVAHKSFSPQTLLLDAPVEVARIARTVRKQVLHQSRKRGVVLGLSGGIDSSVTAALCVEAVGAERVVGVLMPEKDSDPESLHLGRLLADHLNIKYVLEDIEPILTAQGCYQRRDDFIRRIFPEFGPGWKCKVVLASKLENSSYNISSLVVESPDNKRFQKRMPLDVYLGVVAAANMKQRTRKQLEYYHADRLNHAVAGTPNRLEYDQGFFVKNGDGAADFKPIAHLYKSQVYQLAEYFQLPDEICERPPTTDTWSLPQTQDEFYFSLPYKQMDVCLYGLNEGLSSETVGKAAGLSGNQVELVWRDIRSKRKVARYLQQPPLLIS
ncbi:MAG: NAD(+) synthase [Hyphomicrobiales bacterium]|nr:NAD(+) synthase [Hyphomicrobiales bacterium]